MKIKKNTIYKLKLSKSEYEDLIKIITEYLDMFEENSYEIDKFTLNILENLLLKLNNVGLHNITTSRIEKLKRKCEQR